MKKLLLSLLYFSIVIISKAQLNTDVQSYNTVAQIAAHSGKASIITVTDSLRGGQFKKYTGTDTADGGIIFKDANNNKWYRQFDGDRINAAWYGLVADGRTDQLPLLKRIITLMNAKAVHTQEGYKFFRFSRELFIPGADSYYYLSDSLLLPNTISLTGEGGFQTITTKLLFPAHKSGIVTENINAAAATNTFGTTISNITVHQFAAVPYNITKHGFKITGKVHLVNCYADTWEGNGFNIIAPLNGDNGNADQSVIERCQAFQCYNGFYAEGADANIIHFSDCDARTNRRWGFWDKGFLGNIYINCHATSSCLTPGQKSLVIHNGLQYYCKHDGILVEPGAGVNWQNDWMLVGKSFMNGDAPKFNPAFYYETGGAYGIDFNNWPGENQLSELIGCYSEAGQPPSYIGQRTIVIGGDHGAGFYHKAAFLQANNNQIISESPINSGSYNFSDVSTLAPNYIGIQSTTGGIKLGFDSGSRMGYFKETVTSNSPVAIITGNTSPALFSRKALQAGNFANLYGTYFGKMGNNSQLVFFGATLGRPATGTWSTGDFLFNTTNTAKDTIGWRCIASGTPGNWEGIPFPGGNLKYVSKSANYTADVFDNTIECTGNSFTITLPNAVGTAGKTLSIVNSGNGTISISTISLQKFVNVKSNPTVLMKVGQGTVVLQSNGANWMRISDL